MEGGKAMALHRPENEGKALEENSRLYIEWDSVLEGCGE